MQRLQEVRGTCVPLVCLAVVLSIGTPAESADQQSASGQARRVSFETDEGTWLSLDIAPDGRTLVFDLLGEIYSLDIDGGTAKPLLTGPAFEVQPIFSPDGRELAFISDRSGSENLWIADADGSNPRQLTHSTERVFTSPAWSADGQYIYVTQFDSRGRPAAGSSLWMYHRLGGPGTAVDSSAKPASFAMSPAPSPDGRTLYFSARGPAGSEYGLVGPYSIYKRNLLTGATLPLMTAATAPASESGVMQPAVAPNGRLLAYGAMFEGRAELRLRNLATGEDKRLAYPIEYPMTHSSSAFQGLLPRYTFTADSREVLIAYGGKIRRVNVDTAESRVIAFNAKVDLAVGPDLRLAQKDETGPVRARVVQAPSLSPDGRTLVFSAFGKLYLMPAGGAAKPKRLTDTPLAADQISENQPCWSPDGRWIVYASWSTTGGHLWRMRADGKGEPARLTQIPAFYRKPVYTPDGKAILALRSWLHDELNFIHPYGERPFPQDVIRIPAEGGRSELITQLAASGEGWEDTPQPPDVGRLHFAGENPLVYVHTRRGLLSFPLSGGDARKVMKVLTGNFNGSRRIAVTDMLLSPDGHWALALENYQLHLIAVPGNGDPELTIDLTDPAVLQRQITDIGADYFDWADGGRSIIWAIGSTFYKIALASVIPGRTERRGGVAEDGLKGLQIAVEQPRDVPDGTMVLHGVTAVTMRGAEIIENADIVVERNRIVALGGSGSFTLPAGAKILDLPGKVVTPGFIDTHAHYRAGRRKQVIDYDRWEMTAALAYGVTASLDPQVIDNMFVYQDLIDAGAILGPRSYSTGPAMFHSARIASKEQAAAIMRKYKDHYRTGNIKSYMIGSRQQRQYMVQAAHEVGVMPTVENSGVPRYALSQVIDGFAANEHASDAVDYYRDVAMLYAQTGAGFSPTTLTGGASGLRAREYFASWHSPLRDPKLNHFTPPIFLAEWRRGEWAPREDFIFERLAASAAKIFRAGGNVGVGSHSELQGLGYHWEMWAYAMGGFTPHEVLQVATRSSAAVIGRSPEVGTLEAGKYADLNIFDENPLADIRNSTKLQYVIKNGRLYEANTLNEVWPRRRKYR